MGSESALTSQIADSLLAKEIVRYLVKQRLLGDLRVLMAVKEYFVDSGSPSDVARKYGLGRYHVRGYVQRLLGKARNNHAFVADVISSTYKHICELNPIILPIGDRYYCMLCDEWFRSKYMAFSHLENVHGDLVTELVNKIVWAGVRP